MLRALLLALSTRRSFGDVLERLPGARAFVRRFVAGTRAADALAVMERLRAQQLRMAVTYLGENVRTAHDAEAATGIYLALVDEIGRRRLAAVPSLKLTHLGLDLEAGLCRKNVERVLERAREHGTRVWIDMESSAYTDRTLELYAAIRPAYPNAACVVQAYLRRTAADVERLVTLGATVRLCKGAYREPPALAYPAKRDVDASYRRLVDRLLDRDARASGVYVGFATHDEQMIEYVRARVSERGIGSDRFEHQMLFGIRGDLHARIARQGRPLRVLVPFGEDWYGYFMRRLAERPANLVFLLKNLARGDGRYTTATHRV
jgi:proline dehydrogenase